jgi:hypothetical protein
MGGYMKKLVTCLLSFAFYTSFAFAQTCPHYAATDRDTVRKFFSSVVPGYNYLGVNGVLSRMANIAYLASLPQPLVQMGLKTQRQAFENEYQALVALLSELGDPLKLSIRPRTRAFIAEVVNSNHLGLDSTTLSGASDEEAQKHSENASAAAGFAMKKLWACF